MDTVSRAINPSPAIVGLGASAGGLAALEAFLGNVPEKSGFAYLIVQHMDPTHRPILATLLQRVTTMPVVEATEDMRVKPNAVYVIPPDRELTVGKGRLHIGPAQQPRGRRLPINVLFASLARDQGQRAIGVVLSGMGSDGTAGLQEIRKSGGLTLAQEPESAQFDSMPRNAIDAGCVDIVAPPEALPKRIHEARTAGPNEPRTDGPTEASPQDPLESILGLLRVHSRHDLSQYKRSSLQRRIERRATVHGLDSIEAYERILHDNPQELDLLFSEVLIGVTSFFRDADTWRHLKEHALPELLARRGSNAHLRAWVVGCSTGEEAYSLAMLFSETADSQQTLQIFASDLSADAIAYARQGLYPERISGEISAERLERFFAYSEKGYRICPQIRDMVLFTQHDVIRDPPFTKLDILSCRNVMIYFTAALQRRLIPLFHYSLRPGGVLILGESETIGQAQSLFGRAGPNLKIYLRNDYRPGPGEVDFPVNRHSPSLKPSQEKRVPDAFTHHPNLQSLADQVLLREHAPAAALVNEAGDVLYTNGRTGKYLEPAAGKANWNIHVMARPGIRLHLAAALRQAIKDRSTVELTNLRPDNGSPRALNLTVQFLETPKALEGLLMLVFKEVSTIEEPRMEAGDTETSMQAAINEELLRSREEIRALRSEMQASGEDLQALNEALQSTNEELQSANEELTTSKEEAQSMNEELQTINGELQSKLDDLALAQSDMQNLLNSTEIATLFLDEDLNIRRFTEKATSLFHLRESDIGRPLSDLASTISYPELNDDASTTLRTLASCTKEISTTDGRWLSIRIMPYRTLTNVIQGVVLTFVDITQTKQLEFRLRDGYSES